MGRRRSATTFETVTVRRHRPDYRIVLFMALLMVIGLILLYSISPARAEFINATSGSSLDTAHFMQKQVINLGAGLAVFVLAAILPLGIWKRYGVHILLLGIGACALLAVLGLFMNGGVIIKTGGAVRWFNLGVTSFQPAELLKFGLLLFLAGFLGRRVATGTVNSLHDTLIPLGVVVGIAILFIVVFQKDMGTGITLLGMVAAMLYAAGLDKKWLLLGIAGVGGLGILLTVTSPHRLARVATFVGATDSSDAASYHIHQALIALGSGGFFGKGLGQGVQAFGYLPEAVNDSIFAILGETFGFIGVVVIIVLFGALLHRILKTLLTTYDPVLKMIAAGVFGLVATHIVVNIGAMTGIFPLTGVTLPFLSFGGTSLVFTLLGLGVVFSISRYTTHQIVKEEADHESTMRRGRVGRTRYTGTRRAERAR